MKKITYIIILLLINTFTFASNNKFEQANKLYSQNKFEDALKYYEELISEGYSSPELFYNAANTCYRLNLTGKAIYYYEKAKLLRPNDDDINYNLELARLRVKNLPPEVPKIFPVRIFKKVVFSMSYKFWGVVSLLLFVLFLVFTYHYFTAVSSRLKKISFLSSIFILFFSINTFIFMQYQLNRINNHNNAVIIKPEINAKSSPDDSSSDLFKIYEGYKAEIETKSDNWYEIKLTDGRKAWVKKDDLMIM